MEQQDTQRGAERPISPLRWERIAEAPRSRSPLAPFAHPQPTPPWRILAEIPLLLLVAGAFALIIKAFVGQAFYIPSSSMEPQLVPGDRVVVSELAYRLHEPNRGDIVVFPEPGRPPEDEGPLPGRLVSDVLEGVGLKRPDETELIKRVVGLPGETIEATGGRVRINGRELVEPYLGPDIVTADFAAVRVPEGHVFVLGDNRSNSTDSRFIGPIRIDSIVGRAVARVWPLPDRWALL